ncbi:dTDP-glucose 4,6-dehydratase [Desulfonatronovibrio magnus]|uniref:dTDP-glucose 4,6-dehydratase n=1 Tax=Desulfonatronovibrio magnus TaxID=698827 RepID=UPI0005EB2364|nr:dTDP-glucose 4,6-dehydratase [Desulfonatronovibrio magnus]
MNSILVTGGAGFIGSNLIIYLLDTYPDCRVVNLDKLTYAGNSENLADIQGHERYNFVHGDIGNSELVNYLFESFSIDAVMHLAAESHVDNSISGPEIFIQSNVYGTFVLLDTAFRYWMDGPFKCKPGFEKCRFLHVSTDEVYGSLGETGLFSETTPYAPNSPYSASKAASDMLVRSYFHTYGMNTVITNCSNNYGPRQHNEKLIPTIIRNALKGAPIPIYGDGKNVRDWLYVTDHCRGLELALRKGKSGETYNIGGKNEWQNISIARLICRNLDIKRPRNDGSSYEEQLTYVADRPGHDLRYAIDASKIETELGWHAHESFESGMEKTVDWYLNKYVSAV